MSGTRGLKPGSERERTFKTVMNNLKLRVILERRKKEIERDKMTVVNRITLNQRITYKRFKRKLNQVVLFLHGTGTVDSLYSFVTSFSHCYSVNSKFVLR